MRRRTWIHLGLAAIVMPFAMACQDDRSALVEPGATSAPSRVDAPEDCASSREAKRTTLDGEPNWVRFCPGPDGLTAPAEVPSDALTTHLDLLDDLAESEAPVEKNACRGGFSRSYRLQIGYADGQVVEVTGPAGPGCAGKITESGTTVRGTDELGVYGVVMTAFGQQYADAFEPVAPEKPLVCPANPKNPGSVDINGASATLDTGYHLGERKPMVMPLAAVGGIVCTWEFNSNEPTIVELSVEQAERVRIGMHAIYNAMVDCSQTPNPTYTAVIEDKTGTRRAVTVIESECETIVRSKGGYGLGFPWLDR